MSAPQTQDAEPLDAGRAQRPTPYAWYVLAILVMIYVVGSLDRSVVPVVAEPLKHEFGLSDSQVGLLGGFAYSLAFGLAVLPMGWLVDRVNRKRLLAGILSVWSALTMFGAMAPSYTALFAARLGVGAAEAGATPASLSLIADTFRPERRNTALGIFYAAPAAGNLLVFLIGAMVLATFGWRSVFLIAGAPGLILAVLLFFTVREPVRGAVDEERRVRKEALLEGRGPSIGDVIRTVFRRPGLLPAILANTIATGVQFSMIVWMTSFLTRVHEVPIQHAALWVGLGMSLVQVMASLAVGPFADRLVAERPWRLALIPTFATLGGAVTGIAMGLAPTVQLALAAMIAQSICSGLFLPPSYSLILNLAPADTRGSTLAVAKLSSIFIGNGLLPFFTGLISDVVGGEESIRIALIFTLAFHFLSAAAYWLAGRGWRRHLENEASAALGTPEGAASRA